MEEKIISKKELRTERRRARKESVRQFCKDHIDLVVNGAIAVLGLFGTVIGIVTVAMDHKMTREDIDYKRAAYYDPDNYVDYILKSPMENEEKREAIERHNNGESVFDILRDMGKL